MLSSFYRKLLFIYISITLVSILAISVTVGYTMERKTYDRSEKLLQEKLAQVEQMAEGLFDGSTTQKEFRKQINALEKNSEVKVSVIKHPKLVQQWIIPMGEMPERQEWVERVLEGEKVTVTSTFAAGNKGTMLIVGQPVMKDGRVAGGLFLYTPIRNIQGAARDIYRAIFRSAVLISLLAIAVLYIVSRHFVKPLQQMSRTAEALATGDFSRRVPVRGQDEIASLAGSLNRMAGKLETVEEGRKRFLSEISHELRTPLTTIRASLQGVVDGVVEPQDSREFIEVSLAETKRLSKLVDDLLQLSSFDEKRVTLNVSETDLVQLSREVVTGLTMKAKAKQIELNVELAEGPVLLSVDTDRIKQVLLNLLDNAINHIPEGSSAGIRFRYLKQDCWMEVWDSGPGIPLDKLPHLFDRFYKADESRNRTGAGLGLAICKSIVEAHGGFIRVTSAATKGTVFSIYLPPAPKSNL
ncbi:sensor histidine kinase [Paenibacillus hexagrammi]|uniref:histidine kinase n=1 Tax=Paenibacillus hexagrammi TaxID=2908839 RepID=A0ABY3SJV3_9BACL|nr:ATP-binding protein [Paenibacillus sp. YPD9-1]UJF33519.1 cell wall metabolism sensor histidine kinase WalK [Paenibacillus sp. YPD9-1]